MGASSITSVPEPGEPRPVGVIAFTVLFVAQWAFLLIRTAWRLWQAGAGQPVVARKRMRTMATAASMLALVIIVSSLGSSGGEERLFEVIVSAVGLLAAPLFYFGFDPPRFLRLVWRQREEAALRTTEIGLVRADLATRRRANAWLPRVSELVGGNGAVVFDSDRSVLAKHKISDGEVQRALSLLPDDAPRYDAVDAGPYRVLAMHNGWLAVAIGPLTPVLRGRRAPHARAWSVVADLALGRARLFELERQSREAMRDFVAIASGMIYGRSVTVIAGFTDLMQTQWDTVLDEQKQDFLSAITRQVTHLDRRIRPPDRVEAGRARDGGVPASGRRRHHRTRGRRGARDRRGGFVRRQRWRRPGAARTPITSRA